MSSERVESNYLKSFVKGFDDCSDNYGVLCSFVEKIIEKEYPCTTESIGMLYGRDSYRDRKLNGKNKMGITYNFVTSRERQISVDGKDTSLFDYVLVRLDQYNTDSEGVQSKKSKKIVLELERDKKRKFLNYDTLDCSDLTLSLAKVVLGKSFDYGLEYGRKYTQQLRLSQDRHNPAIIAPYIIDVLSSVYGVNKNCVYAEGDKNRQLGQDRQVVYNIKDTRSKDDSHNEETITENYSALTQVKIYDKMEEKIKKAKYIFHITVGDGEDCNAFQIRNVLDATKYLDLALTSDGLYKAFDLYKVERAKQKEEALKKQLAEKEANNSIQEKVQ